MRDGNMHMSDRKNLTATDLVYTPLQYITALNSYTRSIFTLIVSTQGIRPPTLAAAEDYHLKLAATYRWLPIQKTSRPSLFFSRVNKNLRNLGLEALFQYLLCSPDGSTLRGSSFTLPLFSCSLHLAL